MRLASLASATLLAGLFTLVSALGTARADSPKPKPDKPIAKVFSCLRGSSAMLIAAHRGGGGPGIPENSIAAFEQSLPFAPIMELDVSGSADGVLFLMHDATLDRTTTGSGKTAESYWTDLQTLRLRDTNGAETSLPIPTLEQALIWSRGKAVLQLDKKLGATWAEIIRLVKINGAEDRTIAIVRSPVEVADIRRLSSRIGISFDLKSADDWKRLQSLGVSTDGILGWTGNTRADPALWAAGRKKFAISFGTLGDPATRIDTSIAADGAFTEYEDLAKLGVDVLGTSTPQNAAIGSKSAAKGRKSCLGR